MFFRLPGGSKADAEQKYARFRSAVYGQIPKSDAYPRKLRLDSVTPTAIRTYREVWLLHERRVNWDWPGEIEAWRRKCPARLEMSVWHEHHLCGLLIARTTNSKKTLYIEGIEGAPYSHPLKGLVIPVCIEAAEAYASMIQATEVRVQAPDPAVVPAYCELGYTLGSNLLTRGESYAYKVMGETT